MLNQSSKSQRRGTVIPLVVISLITLLGFASLTVDVGALYNTRADLQNAADAAALAGASVLTEELMMSIRLGEETSTVALKQAVYERASAVAAQLVTLGGKSIQLEPEDVLVGWIDRTSPTSFIDLTQPADKINAVHVIARRTTTSANGPVSLFFAGIFGKTTADVTASATAAFDDSVTTVDLEAGPTLFPFTIDIDTYDFLLAQNNDHYQYDSESETVSSGSDVVPELNIYPKTMEPGNWGRLEIGSSDILDQILTGVSAADLKEEVGTPNLVFSDEDGNPITYIMDGATGVKAELEDEIRERLGDIVAIPIHSTSTGSGTNATFTIVAVRYVRVMHVQLTGRTKGLWLQPATYTGSGVTTEPGAPGSDGTAGQVVLVR